MAIPSEYSGERNSSTVLRHGCVNSTDGASRAPRNL